MDLPFVPVIIKRINPTLLGDSKVEPVTVVSVHAFPIQFSTVDETGDTDALNIEPRLACVINGKPYLLRLSPDREKGAIIYETFIEYVPKEPANDESDIQGFAGSEEDSDDVSRPDNGSGDEASGGDETPDGSPVHH